MNKFRKRFYLHYAYFKKLNIDFYICIKMKNKCRHRKLRYNFKIVKKYNFYAHKEG